MDEEIYSVAPLIQYILKHTESTGFNLADTGEKIFADEPVNMYFFDVFPKENPEPATQEQFLKLIAEHNSDYPVDVLHGEHGYIELGAWVGDQGLALRLMALGKMLDVWSIMHPGMILDITNPQQKGMADQMAGMGMVSILNSK